MPKRNDFLARIAEGKREAQSLGQYFNERQALDCMILTLNRDFGFGPERVGRFLDAYIATRRELAELTMEDHRQDKDFWYAKDKVDKALRSACGEDYPDWDERYKMDLRKPLYDGGIVIR